MYSSVLREQEECLDWTDGGSSLGGVGVSSIRASKLGPQGLARVEGLSNS